MLPAAAAFAAPATVPIGPQSTQIDLVTYALGLFGLPAEFQRFSGTLSADPADPQSCKVSITIQAASLHMDDQSRQSLATGPKLLDVARFPTLHYEGSCADHHLVGSLTMHGVTHPLALQASRDGDEIIAQGSLRRGDYDMNGLPGLIGRTVHITFKVALPSGLAAALDK
jgi:polyisoprenoid-binding protein YceI